MIAKNESDLGGFRNGNKVIHDLIKLFKGVQFQAKHTGYGSQINLDSKKEGEPGLVFRKDDKLGWYWAGIVVGRAEQLEFLMKQAYRPGSSED